MKITRLTLLVFFLTAILILIVIIYRGEQRIRVVKEDLVELSLIKYGLFNVDEWKLVAAGIIAGRIDEIELTGENKEAMRQRISAFLYDLIDDFEQRFHAERSGSLKGILQSGIASLTGTFNTLRQDVPVFTEQIIGFLDDPQSKIALRAYIAGQFDKYTLETFSQNDYTIHDQVLAKYGYDNRNAALAGLEAEIIKQHNKNEPYRIVLIILVVATSLVIAFLKVPAKTDFVLFFSVCIALLVPGVLLPMIEIDARIADLSFSLIGEKVSFQNQILFYQSKSILEVVQIMFEQKGADLILVGLLILAFSVIFPVSKLFASFLFIYFPRMQNHSFVRMLVFNTGKWSMADVMVIAIFMAFIGFNGIISGQLNQIENISDGIDVLTTNKSGILAGFWFFTSFVILSLIVSQKLHDYAKPQI